MTGDAEPRPGPGLETERELGTELASDPVLEPTREPEPNLAPELESTRELASMPERDLSPGQEVELDPE